MDNLTSKQLVAIRCAIADLIGAAQARQQQDIEVHDWDSHKQTIEDLITIFGQSDYEWEFKTLE